MENQSGIRKLRGQVQWRGDLNESRQGRISDIDPGMITLEERSVLALINDDELIRWVQELTRIPSVWRPATSLAPVL